jgi:predicted lysophospholipase L1 biosynthesis ABC-type transport system permease subunit
MATPAALRGIDAPGPSAHLAVSPDVEDPDVIERLYNAVAPARWRATVNNLTVDRSGAVELFLTIRNALLGGSLFTLLLAGVSMLVLALEQVGERRRPFAALVATGVPTRILARSLLWQNLVPVLLAVGVAVVAGTGLAALVFRLTGEPFQMDWLLVALYSGIAAALVLLVTALTLPTLRSATRLAALRSE